MSVLVFSTPFCAKCPGVKQKLKVAGIEFEEINAIKYPQLVKEYNVKAVPTIVVVDGETWQSYNESTLGELIGL
jgi:glutaredoxin